MDPSSLLAQLRDVHSPETIGVWPPAIGLVILVLLACVATATIILFIYRWYHKNAWRRFALKEFILLHQTYNENSSMHTLTKISSLLKRCSASVNNNNRMLALTGDTWKDLLQTSNSPLNDTEINLLCFGHYQAKCDRLDNDALLRIRKWIKTLRPITQSTTQINKEPQKASVPNDPINKQTTTALHDPNDQFENKTS
ncbi:MAG: hypothetical protein ACI84K_001524 [Pseudohongiellaceae bacterium]|jgi:hypothetical protein